MEKNDFVTLLQAFPSTPEFDLISVQVKRGWVLIKVKEYMGSCFLLFLKKIHCCKTEIGTGISLSLSV